MKIARAGSEAFDDWLPGSDVRIRAQTWRVRHARRHRGVVRLDVENRGGGRTFLVPFDRPQSVQRRRRVLHVRPQQARARVAGAIARAGGFRALASALDARIVLLPYQLEAAVAIVDGSRRLLIADEVGLGKTIQAGIAIAEVQRRERPARILLIVPAGLRAQWVEELSQRFRLVCMTADRPGLDMLSREGGYGHSPWQRPGIWIGSIDFLKQPHVIDAMPLAPWDLVAIDEAHGVCGDSDRFHAANRIATRSRRILLLTATPHSGDEDRFARLLALGALPQASDPLTILRRTRRDLALPVTRNVRWRRVRLSDAERTVLHVLREYERAVLETAGAARRDAALLLLSVFRKRALSTMSALSESVERRLQWLLHAAEPVDWRQPSLVFEERPPEADDFADADWRGLAADVGVSANREVAWLRRLSNLARAAARADSKIAVVASLLARTREPAIVFTEFRHSLGALQRRLEGVRNAAVLHGGLTAAEASRELERFKGGGASLLLATDVAGQGLNLQGRSRWVISLELPWNPARLEQRAGRVDRIGQTRGVHLTLLVARHQAEAGLLAHLARRTLVARHALGNDLLPSVPDESRVRATLFTEELAEADDAFRAAPEMSGGRLVAVSSRWARHGRTEARRLLRARRLASRWRARDPDPPTGCWTTRRSARVIAHGATLVVLLVPLVDRLGGLHEHRLVALRVEDDWHVIRRCRGRQRLIADAARAEVRPRAARLSRVLSRRMANEIAVERDIASILIDHRAAAALDQPGLFDRRFNRARLDVEADVDRLNSQLRSRLEQNEARTSVRPGKPAIVLAVAEWP